MLPREPISLLVDNDSWILPHVQALQTALADLGYAASLCRHADQVRPGIACFMLGCVSLVPEEVLARNKHNLVVHESALPQGRGFAPMTWQILAGRNSIPICLLEATAEADAGPIWLRDSIELDGSELCDEWRRRQGEATVRLCLDFVQRYQSLQPQAQQGEASHYRRRGPADSELDPNLSLAEQFELLRVVDNERYPAFFHYRGRRYRLAITPDEGQDHD
ncbi:formyltransferase family protein [Gallaecimonas sp. GXIMD4217]|uniref:formyltransferase family protein n=1 Tax=Gallaecimonas sp. GXIMD4217 TaxID=3131927 RepID=UPI00311AE49C